MAYDEDLAERIREVITESHEVTEQKMFGGLAFLVGGNMAVVASGQGGLMVRADPAECDHLVGTTAAEAMVMRGRPLGGWLRLESAAVEDEAELRRWVDVGATYAASLPPKPPKKR